MALTKKQVAKFKENQELGSMFMNQEFETLQRVYSRAYNVDRTLLKNKNVKKVDQIMQHLKKATDLLNQLYDDTQR